MREQPHAGEREDLFVGPRQRLHGAEANAPEPERKRHGRDDQERKPPRTGRHCARLYSK
jgi:hypothetical protein